MLYEYEKEHNILEIIKEYIHGNRSSAIGNLRAGDVYLPSPFLLDELEWSLNIHDYKVQEIIYQLKIVSREFYKPLIDLKYGEYPIYFNSTSSPLGKKIINYLKELKLLHNDHAYSIFTYFNNFSFETPKFASKYYNIFSSIYGLCIFWGLLTGFHVFLSLELYNVAEALLVPITICITAITGILNLKKLSILAPSMPVNNNLLASRYRDLVMSIKNIYDTGKTPCIT